MNGEPKQGGRGAICRDVSLDLQRARDEHNVRLVVCCLDDDELAYLGVPWSEYSAALDALGMDVVRLPMVEGFAPSGPQELDAVLSRIVRRYTLRGASVLAHCRGGIGRAGLVASAWMVKMGLVAGPRDGEDGAGLWEGEEPLRIVERVVELVRRRRRCVGGYLLPFARPARLTLSLRLDSTRFAPAASRPSRHRTKCTSCCRTSSTCSATRRS